MGRMIDMTLMEKKTLRNKLQQNADQIQHFGLRKLSIGVTSVLLSTLFYVGTTNANVVQASAVQTTQLVQKKDKGATNGAVSIEQASQVKEDRADNFTTNHTKPETTIIATKDSATDKAVSFKQLSESKVQTSANRQSKLAKSTTQIKNGRVELNAPENPIEISKNQDASSNKQEVGNGKAREIKLDDGNQAQAQVTNDQLDDQKLNSTITLSTNNFQPDDQYQIYVPKGGISIKQSDISSLSPAFGTTTFDDSDNNYYIITDKFISAGNISQNINLGRTSNVPGLNNAGSFEKIINHAYITKNGQQIGNFELKVIEGAFDFSEDTDTSLKNVTNKEDNVDLITKISPNTANVASGKDLLTHLKIAYNDLPDYYTPKSVEFTTTDNGEIKLLDNIDITDSMIVNKAFTIDLPIDENSPFRSMLFGGQPVIITLSGKYNVPENAFDEHNVYKTTLSNPTITLTDQSNYSVTHSAGKVAQLVYSSRDNLNWGAIVKVNQDYTADYVNNDQETPNDGTVNVDENHKNKGSGLHASFTPISNIPVKNVVISLQTPDGIKLHSIQMSSNNRGIQDLDSSYGIQITYTDGSTQLIKAIPTDGKITGSSTKSIRSVSVKYDTYTHEDDLSFDMNHDSNFELAKNYANGNVVQSGDLLTLKTTILGDGYQPAEFDTTYDRLTTYKENDQLGILMAGITDQSNQKPGELHAGYLQYEASASDYGNPHLDHPVMYIQVPDNAVWDQTKPLQIRTGMTAFWGDSRSEKLTPKNISTVDVDGHTFLKIDLSNYSDMKYGFSVIVNYNNGIDFLTSTKYSPFMVVADNLDQNVNEISRPTTNGLRVEDREVFNALIKKEHINVQKASYNASTAYYHGEWKINTAAGTTSATMTQGNTYDGPSLDATQDINGNDPTHFKVFSSIVNADPNATIENATQVINLPSTADGKSGFTPVLTGPVTLTDPNTKTDLASDATITYYTDRADLDKGADILVGKTGLTADQVTDWSSIKAIKVVFNKKPLNKQTTARVTMSVADDQIYDHVGKTIYASSVIYSTNAQGSTALPKVVINPATPASAKLTVVGKAKIKTIVHYIDDNGTDHYIELPDKLVTYNDGTDTMRRTDFLSKDSDLTSNDHLLLPEHMVLDYAHPTIKNSDTTYLNNYPNGTAEFGKSVKYDFDGDAVIFEGKVAKKVTQSHQIIETIHYVKADGSKIHDDVVQKSKEFKDTGYQNPFTGEIKWSATGETDTLSEITNPQIEGYNPNKSSIPAIKVEPNTSDIEKTVVYSPNDEALEVQYIDDTDNKTLESKTLNGKFDENSNYSTENTIKKYYDLGYDLVFDPTNQEEVVFNGDNIKASPFKIHLKFVGHRVTVKIINDSTGEVTPYSTSGRVDAQIADDQLKDPVNSQLTNLTQNWYDNTGNTHTDGKYAPYELVSNNFTHFDGKIGDQDQNYEIHIKEHVVHESLEIPIALPPIVQVDSDYADQLANSYTDGSYSDTSNPDHQKLIDHTHLVYGTLVPNTNGQVDTLYPHSNYSSGNIQFNLDGTPYVYEGEDQESLLNGVQGLQKTNHLTAKLKFDFNLAQYQNGDDNNQGVSNLKLDLENYHGFDTTGYHNLKMLVQYPQSGSYKWISLDDPTVLQADMSAENYLKSVIEQNNGNPGLTVDGINISPSSTSISVYYSPNYETGYGSQIPGSTIANKQYQKNQQDADTPYMPQNSSGYVITYITMVPNPQKIMYRIIDDTDRTGNKAVTDLPNGAGVTNGDVPATAKSSYQEIKQELQHSGYEIASADEISNKFGSSTINLTIHVKHGTMKVSDPNNWPTTTKNQDKVDLTKTVTRDINYIDATNNQSLPSALARTQKQTTTLTRTAIVDKVTGRVIKYVNPIDPTKTVTSGADAWSTGTWNDVTNPDLTNKGYNGPFSDENGKSQAPTVDGSKVSISTNTDPVNIYYRHKTITVTTPTDSSKFLPDNPNKNYPTITDADLTKTVTRKIYIQGNTTPVATQQVIFNRDATIDEVTGKVEYSDWTTANNVWNSYIPTIGDNKDIPAGYHISSIKSDDQDYSTVTKDDHGDLTGVGKVGTVVEKGQDGKFDPTKSTDVDVTINYEADKQKLTVKFIDDDADNGKVLKTVNKSGLTNADAGYSTKNDITNYQDQHYVLVSDSTNGQGLTFDNQDKVDQTYEVHFKHETRTDEQDVQVPRTIKYVYQNGQQAQPEHKDALKFHETKVVDLVDGHTVSDNWTPAQDFKTITTPKVQGYTPDHEQISNTKIKHDHPAVIETVTYNPDAQKAAVKYIDDTTGQQLSAKGLAGYSDQSVGYNTKPTIDKYVAAHYDLVSDDTKGQNVVFDHDDNTDQHYEVHLTHHLTPINDHREVNETVHYQYADGSAAHNDYKATPLEFNRTGERDEVTGTDSWNAWIPGSLSFDKVQSPVIQGYTPSEKVIDVTPVDANSKDVVRIVTYTPDAQTVHYRFVDDDNKDQNGKPIQVGTDVVKNGKTDQTITYHDGDFIIPAGYELVSMLPTSYKFKASDNDPIDIHLKHKVIVIAPNDPKQSTDKLPDNPSKNYPTGVSQNDLNEMIKRQITVVRPDGSTIDASQLITLTRTATIDEVTGKVIKYSNWTIGSFSEYNAPEIQGYTPNRNAKAVEVVKHGDHFEPIKITYISLGSYTDDTKTGDYPGNTSTTSQSNSKEVEHVPEEKGTKLREIKEHKSIKPIDKTPRQIHITKHIDKNYQSNIATLAQDMKDEERQSNVAIDPDVRKAKRMVDEKVESNNVSTKQTLPQTGQKSDELCLIGLSATVLGALTALLGTMIDRKRK